MPILEQVQLVYCITIITLSTLMVLIIISLNNLKKTNVGIPPGKKIPYLSCKTLDNELSSSYSILNNNEKTLLCAVATSCPACNDLINKLSKFTHIYKENIILLTFGNINEVKEWFEKIKPCIVVYILDNHDMKKKLKINAFPFGMIVNKQGEVINSGVVNDEMISRFLNNFS